MIARMLSFLILITSIIELDNSKSIIRDKRDQSNRYSHLSIVNKLLSSFIQKILDNYRKMSSKEENLLRKIDNFLFKELMHLIRY